MNPALWEALLTEHVRDRQADACRSRLARQLRRTRHRSSASQSASQILIEEGQLDCLQATGLRSA